MDREKRDGNTILLTVIGVATLLVALVGATFAYFSTQINNESNQSVGITTAAPVGLQYLGQKFEMTNIIPGVESTGEQGTFTVENPSASTVDQKYDLKLVIDENTLNNLDGAGQLLLKIVSSSEGVVISNTAANATTVEEADGNGVQWDLTAGDETKLAEGTTAAGKEYVFVKDQRIAIGKTQTYKMTLNFVNFDKPQDNNQGKTFRAHIDLVNPVSVK